MKSASPYFTEFCPRKTYFFLLSFFFSLYVSGQPVINSFSPASGAIGSTVTISGSNFSSTSSNNIVFFGGVRATVTNASPTSLSVAVPVGATYQPITVTVNNLVAYAARPFNILLGPGEDLATNSFNQKTDLPMPTTGGSTRVVLVDMDGDGKNDLVSAGGVVNNNIGYVVVHKNNSVPGAGFSFPTRQDFPVDTMPNDLFACDFDGDGKKDIAVTHTVAKKLSIYRNTSTIGSISFATRIDIALVYNGTCVTATDFDKDGKSDIAIGYDATTGVTKSVAIFRNTSSPGILSFAAPLELTTGFYSSMGASTGDIDNDGKTDLVVSTYQVGDFSVFRNLSTPGNLSFAARVDIGNFAQSVHIAIADMDGDGRLDLVTAPNQWSQVHRNTGSPGTISFDNPLVIPAYPGIWMPGVDDFDGDGKPDIAFAIGTGGPQPYGISAVRNLSTPGNFSFGPVSLYQTNISTNSTVAIGDIDGNNLPDIAVSNFAPGIVTLLRNRIYSPRITSFVPTSACFGKTVAINGFNFTGTTSVVFGFTSALSFNVVSANLINAVVGNGSTGNIVIMKPGGINGMTFATGFTFVASSATITSFTPTTATTGNTVTITGTNFTNVAGVAFGGVLASSFTVISPTTITAVVGTGASGDVSVMADSCITIRPGFTFGTVTAIGDPRGNNSPELTVNPNPGNDIIFITHAASTRNAHLKFIDMKGRTLRLQMVPKNITQSSMTVRGLPSGIYKLFWSDDKKTFRRTVMIAR